MNRDALISVAITAAPVKKTNRCGGTPDDLFIKHSPSEGEKDRNSVGIYPEGSCPGKIENE
jgi:hypothetical protein